MIQGLTCALLATVLSAGDGVVNRLDVVAVGVEREGAVDPGDRPLVRV
jgi:hypothetical protein